MARPDPRATRCQRFFTAVSVDSLRRTSCRHCCYLGMVVREIKGFGTSQPFAKHRTFFCCICSALGTERQPPAPTGHSPRPLGCLERQLPTPPGHSPRPLGCLERQPPAPPGHSPRPLGCLERQPPAPPGHSPRPLGCLERQQPAPPGHSPRPLGCLERQPQAPPGHSPRPLGCLERQPQAPSGHSPRPLGCLLLDTTYCRLAANGPAYLISRSLGSEQDSSLPACDAVYTHLGNQKVPYRVLNSPSRVPIPSQVNTVHNLTPSGVTSPLY